MKIKTAVILAGIITLACLAKTSWAVWAGWNSGGPVQLLYATPVKITVRLASVSLATGIVHCSDDKYVEFLISDTSPQYKKLLSMLMFSKAMGTTIGWSGNGCNGAGMHISGDAALFIE